MFPAARRPACIAACATVQRDAPIGTLLAWVEHEAAQQNEAQVSLTGKRD